VAPAFIGGVPVFVGGSSLYWIGAAAVDADGAPNAYCLDDDSLGLDDIRNAKDKHGGWVGILTKDGTPTGEPIRQKDGPFVGFPISPTSLVDKGAAGAARYVDATRVSYIAVPPELRVLGVRFGDMSMVVRRGTGGCTHAIVADGGPHGKLGEVSIKCADSLCFPSSPRDGGLGGHNLLTVVFPGSFATPRWPRTEEDMATQAAALFAAWSGLARALALLA
jgi:hypothetical protein